MRSPVREIEALVSRAGTHPVWGYVHCLRVHALAEELAYEERISYDPEILYLAALLHDIGLYKAYALREAPDHARRSAAVAGQILPQTGFMPLTVHTVCDAIEHHPPGHPRGSSVEADLLKDAVALDYLGAIGLSRVFAMIGLEEDVPDLAAAVRHARSLHQSIPGLLMLQASRDLARDRTAEAESFLQDLGNTTAGFKLL